MIILGPRLRAPSTLRKYATVLTHPRQRFGLVHVESGDLDGTGHVRSGDADAVVRVYQRHRHVPQHVLHGRPVFVSSVPEVRVHVLLMRGQVEVVLQEQLVRADDGVLEPFDERHLVRGPGALVEYVSERRRLADPLAVGRPQHRDAQVHDRCAVLVAERDRKLLAKRKHHDQVELVVFGQNEILNDRFCQHFRSQEGGQSPQARHHC